MPRTGSIAILSPGPSLVASWHGGRYDVTIAVNRAIHVHQADVWAFIDLETFKEEDRGYKSIRLTRGEAARRVDGVGLAVRDTFRRWPVQLFDDIVESPRKTTKWDRFTTTAAMVWASAFSPDTIDIYGVDMEGSQDYDGATIRRQVRDESRWIRERQIFQTVTAWLADRNIEVKRK